MQANAAILRSRKALTQSLTVGSVALEKADARRATLGADPARARHGLTSGVGSRCKRSTAIASRSRCWEYRSVYAQTDRGGPPRSRIARTSGPIGGNRNLSQEIFRPQNCGAVAQTLPATGRAQNDPRLLQFYNGFCVQSDRSAADAGRAGGRELTRLDTRFPSNSTTR